VAEPRVQSEEDLLERFERDAFGILPAGRHANVDCALDRTCADGSSYRSSTAGLFAIEEGRQCRPARHCGSPKLTSFP
jgi:hypothetical protein